jgi:glyceraldehyde-3-phosphate dehydrogenase/erythrose-4-phosphate dehydrogenase
MATGGINNFGHFGCLVLRAFLIDNEGIMITCVNDPFIVPDYMVYILKFGSTHSKFPGEICVEADSMIINDHTITVFQAKESMKETPS